MRLQIGSRIAIFCFLLYEKCVPTFQRQFSEFCNTLSAILTESVICTSIQAPASIHSGGIFPNSVPPVMVGDDRDTSFFSH